MLTKENLLWERPFTFHKSTQYLYRYENGYGLSVLYTPTFTPPWDIAILENVSEDGETRRVAYDREIPDDIDVFETEEEVNIYIARAGEYLSQLEEL